MTRYLKVAPRLPVANLRRTIDFYTGVLGFEAGDPWPSDAPAFVIARRDDVTVQFNVGDVSAPEPTGHATLSFDVDDALALHAALAGRVSVEWGPEVYWYGRREFAIRDPDGYLIIFSEETTDAPTCREE